MLYMRRCFLHNSFLERHHPSSFREFRRVDIYLGTLPHGVWQFHFASTRKKRLNYLEDKYYIRFFLYHNRIHIRNNQFFRIFQQQSIFQTFDGNWHIKQPKTYSSYRKISYPDFVISRISGIEGRIIKRTRIRSQTALSAR